MRRFALMLASLAAAAACAVEPGSTLHRYVAPSTEVVTNAWTAVSNRTDALIRSVSGSAVTGDARMLPPYLHELSFSDTYPEDAAWYHAMHRGIPGCSVRRRGNLVERNYDWTFDGMAEFVVHVSAGPNRFASVGVANVGTNLVESFVSSGAWSRFYRALPGHTVDGVNERGVFACANVVGGTWSRTSGSVHGLGAVRWVLDNAADAGTAASNLADRVFLPTGFGMNLHFLVADASSTWLVENCAAFKVSNGFVLTNHGVMFPDLGGSGTERGELLWGGAPIEDAWYTRAYLPETSWISDFGGDGALMAAAKALWASAPRESHRGESRGGETWWQTVHTSVYDLGSRTARVCVQENPEWYSFAVASAYTKDETDARLADKADEFTPWVVSGTPDSPDRYRLRWSKGQPGRWNIEWQDRPGVDPDQWMWVGESPTASYDAVVIDDFEGDISFEGITAARRRVLRTGDVDQLHVTMQLVGDGPYTVQLDGGALTYDKIREFAQTRSAVIQRGRGTYRVTYIGQNEMMWDCTGTVQGRVLTGMIHMFRDGDVVQLVEPRELVTPEVLSFLATNVYSIAIGSNAVANANRGIAIGLPNASGAPTTASAATSIAIGVGAKTTGGSSLAIGSTAIASAANAVQIGSGSNTEAGTLKFRGYTVVGSDGRIPVGRLPAGGADVQADMLDGVYYRRLIYDGSVYYVAVTNMPPLPQEYEIDDPEEVEP